MATEVIAFPDLEALLVDYLNGELPRWLAEPVPLVSVQVPDERPDTFVVVPRRGGTRRNLVTDQVTIGVESWSTSPQAAYDVVQVVRGLIFALRGATLGATAVVYRVQEYAGPANLPDPVSAHSRYVATFAIDVRGVAIIPIKP